MTTWWHDDAQFIYLLIIDASVVLYDFFMLGGIL